VGEFPQIAVQVPQQLQGPALASCSAAEWQML
jgi:hypothetical protein